MKKKVNCRFSDMKVLWRGLKIHFPCCGGTLKDVEDIDSLANESNNINSFAFIHFNESIIKG